MFSGKDSRHHDIGNPQPLNLKNLESEIKETTPALHNLPLVTPRSSVKQVLATRVASTLRGDGAVAGLLPLMVPRNGDTVQIWCAIAAYLWAQEDCVDSYGTLASSQIVRTVRQIL
jgi:hypothetical protein